MHKNWGAQLAHENVIERHDVAPKDGSDNRAKRNPCGKHRAKARILSVLAVVAILVVGGTAMGADGTQDPGAPAPPPAPQTPPQSPPPPSTSCMPPPSFRFTTCEGAPALDAGTYSDEERVFLTACERFRAAQDTWNQQTADQATRISALAQQVQAASATMAQQQKDLAAARDALNTQSAELTKTTTALADARSALTEADKKAKAADADYLSAQARYQTSLANLQTAQNATAAEKARLQQELDSATAARDKAQQSRDEAADAARVAQRNEQEARENAVTATANAATAMTHEQTVETRMVTTERQVRILESVVAAGLATLALAFGTLVYGRDKTRRMKAEELRHSLEGDATEQVKRRLTHVEHGVLRRIARFASIEQESMRLFGWSCAAGLAGGFLVLLVVLIYAIAAGATDSLKAVTDAASWKVALALAAAPIAFFKLHDSCNKKLDEVIKLAMRTGIVSERLSAEPEPPSGGSTGESQGETEGGPEGEDPASSR